MQTKLYILSMEKHIINKCVSINRPKFLNINRTSDLNDMSLRYVMINLAFNTIFRILILRLRIGAYTSKRRRAQIALKSSQLARILYEASPLNSGIVCLF